MENIEELKQELEHIKGLVQNLEGKIESLKSEKEDKFAELKEAHKNGAVIQWKGKRSGSWHDIKSEPKWKSHREYRIKPEEEPKVGGFFFTTKQKIMTCYICEIELSPEEVELCEVCPGDRWTPPDYINTCPHCGGEL